MCKMKRGRLGSYIRDGVSIEVIAEESDSPDKLIERGIELFQIEKSSNEHCG